MTYKQIEASREARLWLTQVLIPAAGVAVAAMSIPEVRTATVEKVRDVKKTIRNKFKKQEG